MIENDQEGEPALLQFASPSTETQPHTENRREFIETIRALCEQILTHMESRDEVEMFDCDENTYTQAGFEIENALQPENRIMCFLTKETPSLPKALSRHSKTPDIFTIRMGQFPWALHTFEFDGSLEVPLEVSSAPSDHDVESMHESGPNWMPLGNASTMQLYAIKHLLQYQKKIVEGAGTDGE